MRDILLNFIRHTGFTIIRFYCGWTCCVIHFEARRGFAWRASRGAESMNARGPSLTSHDASARGRGEEGRGCGAHALAVSRWPLTTSVPRSRLTFVPFTCYLLTIPSNGLESRRTGIRLNGYHIFVPSGIYDIKLWAPTLLVHHLLSQSARLTRRIDMRQARDVVSTQMSIFTLNIKKYIYK